MKTIVTDGQLGQLAVKQHELFRRAKEGNYASLDDVLTALQQVIEGQTPTPPVRKAKSKSTLLVLENDRITMLALASPFNPLASLKTLNGLWVSDEFESRILSQASVVNKLDSATCSSYNLKKNLCDREIISELPGSYEWSASEICVRIAQMIGRQPSGSEGDLLNNGYSNLFYVPGRVVNVTCYAVSRRWDVFVWKRGVYLWNAGSRVFVRNLKDTLKLGL